MKLKIMGDDTHVVTDDDFITALEEIKERDKEKEEDKKRRKVALLKQRKIRRWEREPGSKPLRSGGMKG